MKFSDIIGQDEIKTHLKSAIRTGQVSHAYILVGEKESGKRMLAEAFAGTLLCDERDKNAAAGMEAVDACGVCKSCRQTASGNNPDIIYVTREKNDYSVTEIRTQVNGTVDYRPYSHDRKVYIIEDAERLNEASQNALLKTIEEPPPYVTVLLLTTNENSLLPTIRSRCIRLSLRPVHPKKIRLYLMERMNVPDYQADMCVAFSQGNLGRAIRLSASEAFREKKNTVLSLAKKVREAEDYEVTEAAAAFSDFKDETDELFDLLQIWYRDVLLYKATYDPARLIFKEEQPEIKRQAKALSYKALERNLSSIERARGALRANVNFELTTELLLRELKEN